MTTIHITCDRIYVQAPNTEPLERTMSELTNAIADMKATTAALKTATETLVKVKAETVSTLGAMDTLKVANAALEAKVAELQAAGASLPAELLALIAESKSAAEAVQAGVAGVDVLVDDLPVAPPG